MIKEYKKALLISAFVFPGAGQLYLKQKLKGIIFLVIAGIALLLFLPHINQISQNISIAVVTGTYRNSMWAEQLAVFKQPYLLIAKGVMVVCWIASCVDVWLMSRRFDKTQANK